MYRTMWGPVWTKARAALLAMLLAGCATVAPTPPPGAVCPPVPEYSKAFRERAAKELDLLPPDSAIVVMILDYARLRAQLQACRR